MKNLILFLLSPLFLSAEALYFNDGNSVRGEIVESNSTHVVIKKEEDFQLFRIPLKLLTKDNQAYVKNNFPPGYENLPKCKKPLSEKDLIVNSRYIDQLVEKK